VECYPHVTPGYGISWFSNLVVSIKKLYVIYGIGRVAQVVEQLPSKCKALSSNFSNAKKKKKDLYTIYKVRFFF
jgi:hypothetical protein